MDIKVNLNYGVNCRANLAALNNVDGQYRDYLNYVI